MTGKISVEFVRDFDTAEDANKSIFFDHDENTLVISKGQIKRLVALSNYLLGKEADDKECLIVSKHLSFARRAGSTAVYSTMTTKEIAERAKKAQEAYGQRAVEKLEGST